MEAKSSNAGKEYTIDTPEILTAAVPTNNGPNFHTNSWGKTYGIATILGYEAHPLAPGDGLLQINGNSDLTSLIKGDKKNGYVQKIYMEYAPFPSAHRIKINVYGAGPTSKNSSLVLKFQDLSYDSYELTIYSSIPGWHNVQYDSWLPQVFNFSWNVLNPV